MSASDVAAWWGAVVATLLFLWELYKWFVSGPKVRLQILPDMIIQSHPAPVKDQAGKKLIAVRAVNVGDAPTTLSNMGISYYGNWVEVLTRKPRKSFVVFLSGTPHQLPFLLQPGDVWDGVAEQNAEMEGLAKKGRLIVEIYQADGRVTRGRIRL
jgi:hypothetical protein